MDFLIFGREILNLQVFFGWKRTRQNSLKPFELLFLGKWIVESVSASLINVCTAYYSTSAIVKKTTDRRLASTISINQAFGQHLVFVIVNKHVYGISKIQHLQSLQISAFAIVITVCERKVDTWGLV